MAGGKMILVSRAKSRAKTRRRAKVQPLRIKQIATPGRSLGFPKNQTVQLRYCTAVNLVDSVGGVLDIHAFRANGIFDPDVTGIGHQPLGRDQWDLFYNHYYVKSAKITVKYSTQSQVAGQYAAVHGLYVSDDLTVPTSWTTLAEAGRAKYLQDSNLNTESKTLTATYNPRTFMRQGRNQAQLGAAMSADPSEQIYFILYAQAADESSMMTQRNYIVQIDYMVQFSEPKDLAQS